MNNALRALINTEEWGDDVQERGVPDRSREKFRMAISPRFNQIRNRPMSVNGIHRRRHKKVRV